MIQIKGQYELSDFKNAQHLHGDRGKLITWGGYFSIGILGLATLGGLVFAARGYTTGYFVALPAGLIIGAFILALVVDHRQILRVFKQRMDLSWLFEIELSNEGFEVRNEYGSSRLPWGIFVKWKEDASVLLLYPSDGLFLMLPKRLFQDNQGLDFVHEKLRQSNVPHARWVPKPVEIIFYAVLFLLIVFLVVYSYISNLPKP